MTHMLRFVASNKLIIIISEFTFYQNRKWENEGALLLKKEECSRDVAPRVQVPIIKQENRKEGEKNSPQVDPAESARDEIRIGP